jgi:hypothetical protein
MSILSNTVFATSTSLKSLSKSPSRSQLFELYAAYLGCESYAALNASNLYERLQSNRLADPVLARARLGQRLKKLGLPESMLAPLENSISKELQLLLPVYSNLVFNDAARYLRLFESDTQFSPSQLSSLNQQLQSMARLDDADARLLSVLLQAFDPEDMDEDEFDEDRVEGSEYWYRQRLLGATLSAAANEWADAFEKKCGAAHKQSYKLDIDPFTANPTGMREIEGSEYWYRQRLSGATLSAAANEWADAYEHKLVAEAKEPCKPTSNSTTTCTPELYSLTSLASPNITALMHGTEKPNFSCSLPADEVIERLENIYPINSGYSELSTWHALNGIQQPEYRQLQDFFYACKEPEQCYAIYLFGLANGVDISISDHWLINGDTGLEWDEDGPAEVVGFDCVELPKITEPQRQNAQMMAERLMQLAK